LNLTFINFNYDRCLEHYLFWSLVRLGVREIDASQIINDLAIIRPYGTIGSILPNDRSRVSFGASQIDPFGIIDRIRTHTESEALHDKAHLQQVLSGASMCIFLGFGFHKQNLDLLSLNPEMGFRPLRTLATVKGIHQANRSDIIGAIGRALRAEERYVELFDMTAPEILAQLRPKITMAVG
jgi:hypothetical protein